MYPKAQITQETLEAAKAAFASPSPALSLQKAGINIAENLIGINLEAPSKKLFPVYSPLRNRIARVKSGVGASAVQWKAITAINSANLWPGVAENQRNSFNTTQTQSFTASFATLGHDDYVGFEALQRSVGFEDVRATAALNLLYSCMISEEKVILGGQATDIGPVTGLAGVGAVTTGGTLVPATTYNIAVSALTLRGYLKAEKAAAAPGPNEADGESTAATVAVAPGGANNSIVLTWDALPGAVAYNVFVDASPGTADYLATVTANTYTVLAEGTGADPNTTNLTGSPLEFTGIIGQVAAATTGTSRFVDMEGGTLTSDGAGGITQFDAILKAMWDSLQLGPTAILCNSQQALDITKKIGGSSNLAYRIVLEDGQRNVVGGMYVGSYLNKFASSFAEGFPNDIPIKIHPFMPAGTIVFLTETLPYPNNQIPNVWEIEALQEYTQYEWALSQRRYEFGIYFMEVLKGYFPSGNAMMVGVGPG